MTAITGPLLRGTNPQRATYIAAAAVTAGVAAYTGSAVGSGNKVALVLPLALTAALLLAVLSVWRFALFLMVMLAVRASVDITRLTGASAGNTATNTTGSRLLDPSSLLAMLFLLAAVLWLAARLHQTGSFPKSQLRRGMVLFVTACAVSVVGSAHALASSLELLRILAIVVMFVVLEQLMIDPRPRRQILTAAYASLLVPLVYTTVRFAMGSPPSELKGGYTRITGTFTQSNTFGRYLMLMIIFGVALYPHLERSRQRVLGVAVGLSSIYLFLSYTRTAILGTLIGLVIVGVLQSKRVLKVLLVVGVCALLLVPQLAGRFGSLTSDNSRPGQASGNSLQWRLDYWTQVLPLANSNPVTGIGLDMTQYHTATAKQPHNDLVRAYVETGIVGLIAYIGLLVMLVRTGRRAVRRTVAGTLDRGVAVGFLACAVAFVAVSLAANVLSNVVTLWYLAAFAAAASAIAHQHEESAAGRPVPVI